MMLTVARRVLACVSSMSRIGYAAASGLGSLSIRHPVRNPWSVHDDGHSQKYDKGSVSAEERTHHERHSFHHDR